MATGVGMGFDLEGLDKAIKNAEKGFDNLIKKGQETEKAIVNNFKNMATQGVDVFVNKLNEANTLLARLGEGKGGKKTAISKSIDDANTLLAVVNKINSQGILSEKSIQMRGTERFVELMNTINTAGKDRTGGRIKQLSEEIDEAKKKLGELQKLLNFYTKGEGKTSYAFADTSATQREAKALMARIEMLEREKEHVQANAALRSRVNDQRIAQQNEINRQYQSSLDKQSQASNNAAKAENRIYEERDKKHEESQRKYEEMGRKMRQQTNQELAAEYEAEQRYNKQRQNNQQSQMEAMRKFAEERAKLEQKEGDKSKTDEHNRLQKEWQEQLKARDAAEKSAIKAEEERYKQQEKQRVANAVATSNNLDKINEQQHRKELQRITDAAKQQQDKEKTEAELNKKRLAWVRQVDEEEKRKHQNELDRINKRFESMRRREENQRREEQARLNTTQGSLASYNQLYSPQGVRSLNQMKTVLKQLETAQANINRATKEGQKEWKQVGDAIKRVKGDIERTEKEMGKFHNRQKGILDTSGQLARAMAAVFSVSAIKGYVNKLMQIRGEFELQQRSLQVLLQNKDEANALWEKTVALAVKSPYTTKQLVTATKQLAAYRIESEKLYETNRMLADVSIGLGVDMNRLILAFGQVKAANFLRGCLGKGTKIQMFDGSVKNVEDVIVGDVILGDDNTERVVSEIIRGREQMYKVCSKDGLFNEYRVNENHILTLFDIEEQKNVDVYVTEYLENQNRYLGATQKGVYDIVVTKDIVDEYYGFVIDKNKRFVIENGIITHNTELRQFSEAGVNMLDELAKRFTALEGRAVSVGEVFERVSKRMVSFADVEAVFKTITSEGGTFYQMQEKQSDTLMGMMLNLKDSYELMLNDIGKAHEGRLKDSISTIKSLVNNWEYWGGIVMPLLEAFMARLIAIKGVDAFGLLTSGLENFRYQMALAGGGVKGFTKALKAVKTSTLIGWLFVLVGALVATANAFSEGADKAGKYAEKLAEFQGDTEDLVQEFKELTATLNDNTKSVEEQDKAYSRIVHTYGDYLSAQDIERENLKNLSGNYDELIAKIERYRKIQEKETMFGFVKTEYAPDSEQMRDVFKVAEQMDKNFSAIKAHKVFQEVAKKLEEGDTFNNTKQAFDYFLKESGLKEAFKKINFDLTSDKRFAENLRDYAADFSASRNIVGTDVIYNPKDILTFDVALTDYFNKLIQVQNEYRGISDESKRMVEENIAEIEKHTVKGAPMFSEYNKFQKLMDYNPFFVGQEDDIERATTAWDKYVKNMTDKWIPQIWNSLQQAPNVDLTPDLAKLYKEGTKESGVAYYRRLEGYLSESNEILELYKKNTEKIKYVSEEEYKKALNLKNALAAIGVRDDKKNQRSNPELERLKKQIQLIKELADEYKKLYDERGREYADTNIMDVNRISAFAEAGLDYTLLKYGTPEDEIANYELLKTAAEGVAGGLLEIARAASKANTEIGDLEQQIADARIDRQLDVLFGNYELSLELEKLNIPPNIAKQLFGIDAIDLTELRKQILDTFALGDLSGFSNEDILTNDRYLSLNKKRRDELANALAKESDMEREEQEKRLKEYIAYARGALTQRAKIKFEEMQKLAEIEKTFKSKETDSEEVKNTNSELAAAARERARLEAENEIRKLDWDAFKSGDTMSLLFQDLDKISKSSLKNILEQLKKFKKEWSNEDFAGLKEINRMINEAEEAANRLANPFKEAKRLEDEIVKDGRSKAQAEREIIQNENLINLKTKEIEDLKAINRLLQEGTDKQKIINQFGKKYAEYIEKGTEEVSGQIKANEKYIGIYHSNIQSAEKQLRLYNALGQAYEAQRTQLGATKQIAEQLLSAFQGIHESLGGEGDDPAAVFAEMGVSIASSLIDIVALHIQMQSLKVVAAELGIAFNAAFGVIGIIVSAVTALASVVGGVGRMRDKSLEKQISRELDLVKKLQRAYEKLGEEIQNAYNIDTLNKATMLGQDNLKAQIAATERMIQAEEDKKKTDHARIAEWKNDIADMRDALIELEETRLEELGGFASDENKKSGAEAFIDAWLEAYKQTGDGLSGLNKQFDEFFEEMVKKQMIQRAANRYLAPFYEEYDKIIDKWSEGKFGNKEAIDAINALQTQYLPNFNKSMKDLAEEMGVASQYAGVDSELSGLSAGVQGITEDTAEVLGAYMNSIRMFVADNNTQLKALVAAQGVDADTPNPMLSQLLVIAEQTRAIRDMFESVIGRGGNNKHSGAYLKVDMG